MLCSALFDIPAKGALDAYKTNLWFAGGIDALLGGNPRALYVRNGSGQITEIGFRGQSINQGQLLAHASAGTAQLHNQDHTNPLRVFLAAVSDQPKITNASAYLGALEFDGTSDSLNTDTLVTFGGGSAITAFLKGRLRSTASAQIIFEHSTNYNSNDSFVVYYDNSISRLVVASHQSTGARYAISEFNVTVTTDAVFCIRVDRAQASGANQCVLFVNGVKQTRTGATGETSPVPSGNFSAARLFTGARAGGSLFSALNLKALAIYDAAKSDADCTAISALL